MSQEQGFYFLKGLRKGDMAGEQRVAEWVARAVGTSPACLGKGPGAFYILFTKGHFQN